MTALGQGGTTMLDLAPLDPFAMLRDFDRLLEGPRATVTRWLPRIDVFDRDKDLVVRVEVAGVSPEDIDITVEDRTLTISGERSFTEETTEGGFHRREIFSGEFRRTLVLPEGLDATPEGQGRRARVPAAAPGMSSAARRLGGPHRIGSGYSNSMRCGPLSGSSP